MPLLDPPLTPPPKIKLSRLRDIGWSKWDPIGLLGDGQQWDDVRYLVDVEVNYMGLGPTGGAEARAKEVVAAILADEELWNYPD